ncbi:Uma2 family endonuclease [Virgibacillus doumboii]|uniref:Uma2 family endonuclease n=1 Tax=Virgibacillus doumboii TaxID=2697503 RepID=UPI0013DFD3BF|nr:Uma2 family endonuclease [Virgibacillus doumboii]
MSLANFSNKMSYADYLKLPEGTTMQIIDGVPYNMSPGDPTTIHQQTSMNVSHLFMNFFKERECEVFAAPFDVRLFARDKMDEEIVNVVQPDISVICVNDKLDDKGCIGAPDLIVEILSLSTVRLDKVIKLNLYADAGVKEYWIADPQNRLIEIFHLDSHGNYALPDIFSTADTIDSSIFKELKVEVSEVFPSSPLIKEESTDYHNLFDRIDNLPAEERSALLARMKSRYFSD